MHLTQVILGLLKKKQIESRLPISERELGLYEALPPFTPSFNRKGSTPKSRTVVKGLRTSGLAWRPFVA
ncbi:hypothetical protein, partial [Stenotrophomonas maltophilia]|uniref:hypothetical protein n=1 Tax=Stenotrophomonas maltophilia TaxID=40324 RepID=UPI0020CB7EA9